MNIYLIYKHTSPSGKCYIGQTKDYKRRSYQHKNSCCSPIFKNAIKKYGWDTFIHEILEENLTLEEANIREPYWIEFHNSLAPNGYNLTIGGGKNSEDSEETRKLKSEVNSGENSYWFGKHHTPESNLKRSLATKGKPKSEEQRLKQSGENHPMYGKHHTEETKNLNKEAHIGIAKGENSCWFGKTEELHPTSKKYIITFPDEHEELIIGLPQFCKKYNLTPCAMTMVAKGKYKQHKGFKCRYATEQEILYNIEK